MKHKPIPRKLKKLVLDALRRHAWNIGVSHYTGDILYMSENEKGGDRPDMDVQASMHVDRRYLKTTLKIFPAAIKRWEKEGDAAVEEMVAHEVAHIATQHMMDLAVSCYKDEGETKDAWETLTTVIGKMSEKISELQKK